MVYEYKCNACGAIFVLETNKIEPPKKPKCTICKTINVSRNWTSPAIVFKGDGFTLKKEGTDD